MIPPSLRRRMQRLGISEADLDETFSRSSGPGGQHVNKVSTAVTLRHRLRNISVTVQDSRSQSANRRLALERLITAIERAGEAQRLARRSAIEKARRRAAKRPRALKERILESKRRRSQIKRGRSSSRTAPQD